MIMRRVCAGVAAVLGLAAGCGLAQAQNAVPATPARLSGRTLSAMIYVRRPPSQPGPSELARFMFQAYLAADGRALVRVWDTDADAYTRPSLRDWTVTETPMGSQFCLGLPQPAPQQICADLHVWGPRIAGLGVSPYVMLDGDLEPGNALIARR